MEGRPRASTAVRVGGDDVYSELDAHSPFSNGGTGYRPGHNGSHGKHGENEGSGIDAGDMWRCDVKEEYYETADIGDERASSRETLAL